MSAKNIILIALLFAVFCGCSLNSPETEEEKPVDKLLPSEPQLEYTANGSAVLKWKSDYPTFKVFIQNKTNPADSISLFPAAIARLVVPSGLKKDNYYKWKVFVKNGDKTITGTEWEFQYRPDAFQEFGYIFRKMAVIKKAPFVVNTYFQLMTNTGKGYTSAVRDNFIVKEDGSLIESLETKVIIKRHIPEKYSHKIILLIDVSTSEAGNSLQDIKTNAKIFIDELFSNNPGNPQVMVAKFSDRFYTVKDYSNNPGDIKNEIDKLNIEWATTNLYGAAIDASLRMNDIFEYDHVEQHSLVIFTDGTDTQGSSTLPQAVNALREKSVVAVGIGARVDDYALTNLANEGYVKTINPSDDFRTKIKEIIENFRLKINSIYKFEYHSPKRGDVNHKLMVEFKNNKYGGTGKELIAEYNSHDFFEARAGIYVNATALKPSGIDTLYLNRNSSKEVTIQSFLQDNRPNITIGISNPNITVQKNPDKEDAYIIKSGDQIRMTEIYINDTNNPVAGKTLVIMTIL